MIQSIPMRPVLKSKYPAWSVLLVVETDGYEGRVLLRNKKSKVLRDMKNLPVRITKEFLYLNATKMYKKKGMIIIETGKGKQKEVHIHEMSRVKEIYKREYKREGVQ